MKASDWWLVGGSLAAMIASKPATADVTLTTFQKPVQGYEDYVTLIVNVYVQFDGTDPAMNFVTAVGGLPGSPGVVFVTDGFFFQSPFNTNNGGRTAPPALFVPLFPELAVDTFATIGAKLAGSETVPLDATALTSGFPTEDGVPQSGGTWGPNVLIIEDGAWFVTPPDAQGHVGMADNGPSTVLIGQFSVAAGSGPYAGVEGTLLTTGVNDGEAFYEMLHFSFHVDPPAPATLAMLAVAGLLGTRRRGRRVR